MADGDASDAKFKEIFDARRWLNFVSTAVARRLCWMTMTGQEN
jgi:hypothetical protein